MPATIYKNAIINGALFDLAVENGRITEIKNLPQPGIDLKGQELFPGLIDVHSHGCVGYDTMDGHLDEMSRFQAENGVTSWLPTTVSASLSDIRAAVGADISRSSGANILGFHLEGPYISEKFKGAMSPQYMKSPDWEEFSSLPNIRMITMAPELDDALDFIRRCPVPVSLGHTACSFSQADEAFRAGAKCVTHAFNAMPPFHHREPSLLGAAIANNAYVQVICDGMHLHPSVVIALYRIFGPSRMLLISDSMCAAGLPDGNYRFGGQDITVKDGAARTSFGALAGSTFPLLSCVKKAVSFGIPKEDAFSMASAVPAQLLGIQNKGCLRPGADADFIVLDQNLNLLRTVIGGKTVFSIQ